MNLHVVSENVVIPVDLKQTLASLVPFAHDNISVSYFPNFSQAQYDLEVFLMGLDCRTSGRDLIKEMKELGLRHVDVYELAAYLHATTDFVTLQKILPIVALTPRVEMPSGNMFCPAITCWYKEYLGIVDCTQPVWDPNVYFLVTKK